MKEYTHLKLDERKKGQRLEMYKLLLRARTKRRLVHSRKAQKTKNQTGTHHNRPAPVATREEFGHLDRK